MNQEFQGKNGVTVTKFFTDVYSNQPNGTLHSYNYFEDESGEWIYNIDFHIDGCFAPVQLRFPKRISITRVIQKAKKIFETTKWSQQPHWNN